MQCQALKSQIWGIMIDYIQFYKTRKNIDTSSITIKPFAVVEFEP